MAKFRELTERDELLFTTRFNIAELYVGVYRSSDVRREETVVRRLLRELGVLEFGEEEAHLFGHITAHLQRTGRPAGDMDVLIAAVSLRHGQSVVTDNAAHFRYIPGLRVETY
jgi:predicted nucleic acid-binding protein